MKAMLSICLFSQCAIPGFQYNLYNRAKMWTIVKQIDIEAEAVEKSLRDNTPHKTGGLKESLRKTKIDSRNNRYGYRRI